MLYMKFAALNTLVCHSARGLCQHHCSSVDSFEKKPMEGKNSQLYNFQMGDDHRKGKKVDEFASIQSRTLTMHSRIEYIAYNIIVQVLSHPRSGYRHRPGLIRAIDSIHIVQVSSTL